MIAEHSIRDLGPSDIGLVVNYFHQLGDERLRGMGVDPAKLPAIDVWTSLIEEDLARPLSERQFYYLIWQINAEPVGHCNLNQIVFADHAYMHLHLWHADHRRSGIGTELARASVHRFFERFQLQSLYCEPYANNPAPNKTLPKLGFHLLKSYDTTPGWINYHQTVNRWQCLTGAAATSRPPS